MVQALGGNYHQTPAHPVLPVDTHYNAHHASASGGDYAQALHHSAEMVQASGGDYHHPLPILYRLLILITTPTILQLPGGWVTLKPSAVLQKWFEVPIEAVAECSS